MKHTKKLLAVILSLVMALSVGVVAFAEEGEANWVRVKTDADEIADGEMYLALTAIEPGLVARWTQENIYDLVPAGIKQNLYFDIWRQLGNTMYYHYYNERRPITPREQEIIEKTFRKYGIEGPIRFRRYVEVPEW